MININKLQIPTPQQSINPVEYLLSTVGFQRIDNTEISICKSYDNTILVYEPTHKLWHIKTGSKESENQFIQNIITLSNQYSDTVVYSSLNNTDCAELIIKLPCYSAVLTYIVGLLNHNIV